MRQIGSTGGDAFNRGQGGIDVKVGWMRFKTQRIEYQILNAGQNFVTFLGNKARIGAVGYVAYAKAQYAKARAVLQAEWPDLRAQNGNWIQSNANKLQLGRSPGCVAVGFLNA